MLFHRAEGPRLAHRGGRATESDGHRLLVIVGSIPTSDCMINTRDHMCVGLQQSLPKHRTTPLGCRLRDPSSSGGTLSHALESSTELMRRQPGFIGRAGARLSRRWPCASESRWERESRSLNRGLRSQARHRGWRQGQGASGGAGWPPVLSAHTRTLRELSTDSMTRTGTA